MNIAHIPPSYLPLNVPGLPMLYGPKGSWCAWVTALRLPHTARFRDATARAAMRGYAESDRIADFGEVVAYFENDDGSGSAPSAAMIEAARWLLVNDAAFFGAVLEAMLADLPSLRAIEGSTVLADDAFRLPECWDEATLLPLVRLNNINLHPVAGAPYIGLDFSCAWEHEHGYGLMMAGTEIVETGGADVGALSWIAARHAEKVA
ncbi:MULTISPECIES: hypothetical protein [unclassified Variovorax]|uniref:DUF6985 domain-containing protein n=1 Tax=unclassified Variovorax TaxID=663243 RepID=UPI0032E5C7D4